MLHIYRCRRVMQFDSVCSCWVGCACMHVRVCFGLLWLTTRGRPFVCILNTLIPWSTFPLLLYLPAPGALITAGNNVVILRGNRVGGWVGKWKVEGERRREKAKSCWYLFSPVAASGSFSLSSLLINRWNITVSFGAHIADFYARWDCIWMYYDLEVGKLVKINACVCACACAPLCGTWKCFLQRLCGITAKTLRQECVEA